MSDPPSYIDYETFLSPSFSPYSFANTLILNTNDPTDTVLDLSTPLSRVLFDVQEIDTHIHNLTTKSALPISEYVRDRDEASKRILEKVEGEVGKLRGSYARLEREVLERYQEADRARLASLRSLEVLRIGKEVNRAVGMGRQLEIEVSEAGLGVPTKAGKDDHRAMVRAVYSILEFRGLMERESEGEELQRVNVVQALRTDLFAVVEQQIKNKAQQIIREFSMSNFTSAGAGRAAAAAAGGGSNTTFWQTEDAKARIASAVTTLYLLSPTTPSKLQAVSDFQPDLLLNSLQTFLQNALTSSLTSISRALTTLPTLERTLVEVSARCQNVVALEVLLLGIKAPKHPFLTSSTPSSREEGSVDVDSRDGADNLLAPLLNSLDTPSLPSYFWRSLASALSSRVQEILNRGGVAARTLRSNRERVGGAIRECVLRGNELPVGMSGGRKGVVNWEREAAVMVGSVAGVLGR
jgi:Golgi transport complex subunit 5